MTNETRTIVKDVCDIFSCVVKEVTVQLNGHALQILNSSEFRTLNN